MITEFQYQTIKMTIPTSNLNRLSLISKRTNTISQFKIDKDFIKKHNFS
jgi:hypothetical protein